MTILGIDPGTAATGYGVVEQMAGPRLAALVECGVIRTRPRDSLPVRLQTIFEGVVELIDRYHPDVLVVEDVFYARNVRTTIVLGHARGVVLLAGARAGMLIHEFPPAEIKKAVVGNGGASKEQVQFMVAHLLRLRTAPHPADAADGVAAALAYCLTARAPQLPASPSPGSRPRPRPLAGRA